MLAYCLCTAPACSATITATVAQHGDESGIRNRLFTTWLPAGQDFAGLDGRIELRGNGAGFHEALVLVGTMPDGPEVCAERNRGPVIGFPALPHLWAGILKSNEAAPSAIGVHVALAQAIPPATLRGTCLVTLVSAGYAFLRPDAALYTTTSVRLAVATAPASGAVQAFGMGGEFKYAPGTANYVGVRANRPLEVDAIAASVSAAPVAGAPAEAGWGGVPRGEWQVTTDFIYLPAPACGAAHLEGHQRSKDYDVLRLADPASLPPPAGASTLLGVPLASAAESAVQATAFRRFEDRVLRPGDCLIAFAQAAPGGSGLLDVENQSTVYFREVELR